MDFGSLNVKKADEGVSMTVVHPANGEPLTYVNASGEKKNTTITMLGITGKVAQAYLREQQNRRIRKAVASSSTVTAEELDAAELTLLAKLTVGWEGIELHGEEYPFSEANARSLYEEFPWLRAQVKAHVDNTALFVGN